MSLYYVLEIHILLYDIIVLYHCHINNQNYIVKIILCTLVCQTNNVCVLLMCKKKCFYRDKI